MSDRLANLEASAQSAADYLDELRSTLADHGAALGALRMRELEQRLAPSLAGPGVPSTPRVVMGGDVTTAGTLGTTSAYFGNGADGDVTISGDTSLTTDKYYTNLTVNSTKRLSTNGCRVFVSGVLTNNGYISNDGTAGNVSSARAGGAGGPAGFVGGGSAGGAGALTYGLNGAVGANISASLGGAGGRGGDSAWGAGVHGDGGTCTAPTSGQGTLNEIDLLLRGKLSDGVTSVQGGTGGGGGGTQTDDGGGGYYGGAWGGGGGGGGGVVLVSARTIVNNGTISAYGGAGGAGYADSYIGGGGGGGGGGVVIIISTSTVGGTVSAAAGGAGSGSNSGIAGAAGTVKQVVV